MAFDLDAWNRQRARRALAESLSGPQRRGLLALLEHPQLASGNNTTAHQIHSRVAWRLAELGLADALFPNRFRISAEGRQICRAIRAGR